MNRPQWIVALPTVWLLAALAFAAAAEDTVDALPSPLVTAAVLDAKIAEVEAATDLTDEVRQQLIALYRKAQSNLETAQANAGAAAAYRETAETAPAQIESLHAARAKTLADDPLAQLALDPDTPLAELERRLQEVRADLAAVQARHDDLEARLAFQQNRPAAVRQRLGEADEAREAASASLQVEADSTAGLGRTSALSEARRWELETRYQALSTEIQRLDQELLSRAIRVDLLEAKRDKEAASIDWIAARVSALEERILATRQQAASAARADAERVRRETARMDPVLAGLAEANAELSRETDQLTAALRELDRAHERVDRLQARIGADYRDARDTLHSGQVSGDLGTVLLEQLDGLPDLSDVRRQRELRLARIAQRNALRLRYRAAARRLSDVEASVSALATQLQAAPAPAQQARLHELVARRLALLERMLETDELHLAKAQELDAAEEALLASAADYKALLLGHLPWLRTEPPTDLHELLTVPGRLRAMLATARVGGLGKRLSGQLGASPVFWATLLLAAGLLGARRRIIAKMADIAGRVGKPTTDSFGHTLKALGLTLLLALPLPLPLGAAGWVLLTDTGGTELTRTLGDALLRVAVLLFALQLLTALCVPKGLAAAHFRWSEQSLALLHTQTRRLAWVFIPAVALLHLFKSLYPLESGGTPARLAGTSASVALAWFLYRLFHPRRGIMAQLRHPEDYPLIMGSYWLWYPLLALYPIVLGVLALSGYLYTVTVEANDFLDSLLLLLTVALVDALALRWLLVVRRRLAYEAALERRRVASEAKAEQRDGAEAAEAQIEEPKVDLSALSDDTRRLIRTALVVLAAVGLALIWSDSVPALRSLQEHTLWHTSVMVDGEAQQRPITLLDLGLALLFAAGILVLLKRLPALLEIVLLRRYNMSAADRYAVTTLTSYVIGAVGILLVLGRLGASWTQLQWLAAALSVGIGFGLQEIVANFISGLIILFERPVRVGDTVTVGDTDGVVTRIRIRATTIRNFDRKELLVPNKEFVTGRLLNWSLSDPVTRILLVVGVAYGSDVDKALAIMQRLAEEHVHVVNDPPPCVTFDTFGDNALTLTLRAYVDSVDVRLATITDLNRAINRAFADAGLCIAFPQRDVHLDATAPLRVQIEPPTNPD
ncbi:MAG: mechanosensitive ion channel [Thiohalocapsa sp.]|jgi:potassium efflux system protein|uniref:mechanosensitive ion channel domain-containing protein n=1 Tax=Thiohalocapsa sp. TaxID=2497641 RepID=UPI002600168C|nr:mechanosensitive ion channel domain-containing protein [Thiohalocapsa sp.]MCG6941405.1 mechanosensitive ion channel [Thiohalocapsa sp.]